MMEFLVEETLDLTDWEAIENLAYPVVKDAVAHIRDVRDRPMKNWTHMLPEGNLKFLRVLFRRRNALPKM